MVKFTTREIRDIIISMFVISLAFAFIFARMNINNIIFYLPITLVVVGFGFILHELAHKFVAIRYGYWAEYKMWAQGLIFALITAYFGIVFAAPGAVYIHGYHIKTKENGIISLAGPATNIVLALIFLVLFFTSQSSLLNYIALLGVTVNSFLEIGRAHV
jgi:Zn-dependent protease